MHQCYVSSAFIFSVGDASPHLSLFFFFNDTATTEIYTLSLHDALPICWLKRVAPIFQAIRGCAFLSHSFLIGVGLTGHWRSEEHTSELQSRLHLVCRLLLEKKNNVRIQERQPCHTNH